MKKLFILSLLWLSISQGNAQSLAQRRCDNLQKGVNLSNWMEGYWLSNWPVPNIYTRDFLVEMKNAGMKSVRMPICFALVTDTLPPYNVDTNSAAFAIVDSVITWTHELDLNLIIDNHHQWTLSDSTWRSTEPRLSHLWSVLAQRYRYLDPEKYYFEILNEPFDITNDSLAPLFTAVVDTIRKYTTAHTIVVSPTAWSGGIGFSEYQPLADTNLIYTFHSYDPFPFTHQGFSWANPYYPTGTPYPNSGFDFTLTLAWEFAMQWRDNFHLPVFLGEFGVGIHPDDASRCNWIDTVGAQIDFNHLSSFSWDVRGDFPLYKSGAISADSVIPCFSEALHLYGNQAEGVQNLKDEFLIQISPNPALGMFSCTSNSAKEVELELLDNTGRKVLAKRFLNQCEVDVKSLARGMYLVKTTADNFTSLQKVIIQ
ncbi:MAG: hypothetical protein JWO06_2891 [Bacteroidota bacterium]|nr:hypothetical protein [Bacteroidota bacterium]